MVPLKSPHRSMYPTFFSEVDIVQRQLADDTVTIFVLGPCIPYSIMNPLGKRIARICSQVHAIFIYRPYKVLHRGEDNRSVSNELRKS